MEKSVYSCNPAIAEKVFVFMEALYWMRCVSMRPVLGIHRGKQSNLWICVSLWKVGRWRYNVLVYEKHSFTFSLWADSLLQQTMIILLVSLCMLPGVPGGLVMDRRNVMSFRLSRLIESSPLLYPELKTSWHFIRWDKTGCLCDIGTISLKGNF